MYMMIIDSKMWIIRNRCTQKSLKHKLIGRIWVPYTLALSEVSQKELRNFISWMQVILIFQKNEN